MRPKNMNRNLARASPVLALLLVGCSGFNRAPATWALPSSPALDSGSTRFTALVTRLDCNSGVTGTVNPPDVQFTADKVVITFTVSPGPAQSASCQSNPEVPFLVELSEPIGDRTLVDGACEAGKASGTAFCEPSGGRRYP